MDLSSSNEESPVKSEPEGGPERKKPKRDLGFAGALDSSTSSPDQRGKDLASCHLTLLESKEFCDISFSVGRDPSSQQSFQCHKVILVSRSPVFRAMFADRWQRETDLTDAGQRKPINLDDIDADSFDRFLQFLYGDVFNVSKVQDVDGLLYLARKYDVELLTEKCAQYMKANVTLKDVVSVYKTANFYCLEDLQKTCREFVRKNMGTLIEKGKFKDFNAATLLDALKSDGVNVREIQLFRALVRWARLLVVECIDDPPLGIDDGSNKEPTVASVMRDILVELLPLVRFPLMSIQSLVHVVHPSGLLSPEDLSGVYQYVCMDPLQREKLAGALRYSTLPRTSSLGSEIFIELYTPRGESAKPTVDPATIEYCRMKAKTHAETLKFATLQSETTKNPSLYISTLVIRGPHDDSIIGSSLFNTIFSNWTIAVTLTAYKRVYGRKCAVETYHKKNIQIYSSREIYLDVTPAIRLARGQTYSIRVQYEVDVNFPADYTVLTGSPLKELQTIPSSTLPWHLTDIVLEADEQAVVEGAEAVTPKATHCIRAIGFKEKDSDSELMDH